MTLNLGMLLGLLAMLGIGFWWAVRIGKKMNRLNQMIRGQEVAKEVSQYNYDVDKKAKENIANNGPVTGPWLRKRH